MTNEQFDDLVSKLEHQARCRPLAYRFRVFLLALLGKGYVGAILVLFVALLAGLFVSVLTLGFFVVPAIAIVGAFFFSAVGALYVKVDPPALTEITNEHAPELFAMINELRTKLGAPRFHHVLITGEVNASIQQLPRLGIFGWPRNYLMVGMPLMKSLTREQFKAVLAHEFGHLARGHGIVSHSIYRQRLRWTRLMAELDATESKGKFVFKPFLDWFVPYFSAFSFPLARANEYEADAISVRLSSSRATAEALTNIEVVGGYLNDFYWPVIDAEFGETPQPSREPYFEMSDGFATRLDKLTCQIWLEPAMARQTTSQDTHPTLRERLEAIDEAPNFNLPDAGQFADGLLGPSLEAITRALDDRWRGNSLPAWQQRYENTQANRRRLGELNEKHAHGVDLTLEERYERAELTESIAKLTDAALLQWRALYEIVPEDARVCLALGSRLLMRDDATGFALIKRAVQFDEALMVQGCEVLCDYHWRTGHAEEYHAWNKLLTEESEIQASSTRERNHVSPTDEFDPHGLSDATLTALLAQLRAVPGLRMVYLMRKRVMFYRDPPLFVLGYRVMSTQTWVEVSAGIQNAVQFLGTTLLVNLDGDNHRLRRKFGRMRSARILYVSDPSSIHTEIFKQALGIVSMSFGILGTLLLLAICRNISNFASATRSNETPEAWSIILLLGVVSCTMIVVGLRWFRDPLD